MKNYWIKSSLKKQIEKYLSAVFTTAYLGENVEYIIILNTPFIKNFVKKYINANKKFQQCFVDENNNLTINYKIDYKVDDKKRIEKINFVID